MGMKIMTAFASLRRTLLLSSKTYRVEASRKVSLFSTLEIRRATQEDKEAVLNIDRNVYCGEDPLPWYYDRLISDPLFDPYIAIKDNKVILFQNGYAMDGGSAFFPRLSRISKEFRKTGLYFDCTDEIWRRIVEKRHTKKIAFTTGDNNPLLTTTYVRERFNQIMTRNVGRFLVKSPCDAIQKNKGLQSKGKVKKLTNKHLVNLLDHQSMTNYLFPRDRIIVDWAPCRIMSCNLPLIMVPEGECASDLVASNTRVRGLLSVGTYLAINIPGFCYNIAIFGSDIGSMHDHILFHLKRLSNLRALPTLLMLYTDSLVECNDVENILERFDIHPYTNHLGHDVKSLIVMEQDLEKCRLL